MITLSFETTVLQLPLNLDWTDEFSWSPVQQSTERSITGALIVDAANGASGRQITLEGSIETTWTTRATLETLRQWAAVAGRAMTLTLRGTPRTVIFDHERGALDGVEPLVFFADPLPDDRASVTLRFLEI